MFPAFMGLIVELTLPTGVTKSRSVLIGVGISRNHITTKVDQT